MALRPAAGDPFAGCRETAVAGGAGTIGGAFTLVDENGATVTDAEVIRQPALVYFGYTFCPDVCPFDAARNAEAVDILEERGIEVTPVFISVDPARDSPEVLAEFTDLIHPRMIGLTGSEAQVLAAAQAYKVYFRRNDPDEDYYLVDHSTFTYLMLPASGFADFFRQDVTAEQMADRVACFIGSA
jgi:protein SCO1/2